MSTDTIYFVIALVGCFVGLGSWLSSRDKRNEGNAEWRGKTTADLSSIRSELSNLNSNVVGRVESLEETVKDRVKHSDSRFEEHSVKLAKVEQKADSAHKRIDDICEKVNR